ncbi:MAG TPA: glycosyltransferase family 2 protein [Rubrobacter sp.]|nr:glycosyltransferase family 2 protein [Rubrobacter sp.]
MIPRLTEAANISSLLEHLLSTSGVAEMVVADGGSMDETVELVRPPVRLVRSEPGRGMQLRAGARRAMGDVLLFLHADVLPPRDVAVQIADAVKAGYVGGNFRLRYPGGGALGRWLETLAPVYRALGRYYGDSGLFVRRDVYEKCGGFPWVPIMEDIIFVRRMERMGPTVYLPGPMFSAARRWKGRPVRTLLLWACMQTAFALGASPWQLARFYKAHNSGRAPTNKSKGTP